MLKSEKQKALDKLEKLRSAMEKIESGDEDTSERRRANNFLLKEYGALKQRILQQYPEEKTSEQILRESAEVKISEPELTAAYKGQKNLIVRAVDPKTGKQAGYIEYTEFQGNPQISFVKVEPDYQKQGIGKQLVAKLQSEYPDKKIDFGMTTPEGTKLKEYIERSAQKQPWEMTKE